LDISALDILILSSYTPSTKIEVLIKLTVYDKTAACFEKHSKDSFVFVPLVSKHGWKEEE
jgi:hypothetical protein